jgi:replicative DNA helicase
MSEILYDLEAEKCVLGSMMLDPDLTPVVAQSLQPSDFGTERSKELYQVMLQLFEQQCPYDAVLITDEAEKLGLAVDATFIIDCLNAPTTSIYHAHYTAIVRRYGAKRKHLALATEYAKKIYSGEEPEAIGAWLQGELSGQASASSATMTWAESIQRQDELITKWETPENRQELQRWSWAWHQWNNLIPPAMKGMLVTVTASDGVGKSMVEEVQAEHWALQGNRVGYFHLELNRDIMLTRRLSRLSGIPFKALITNNLTADQRDRRDEVKETIKGWPGQVEYVHCPGWNVDQITNEARALELDAVVLDYFNKIQMSPVQERRRLQQTDFESDTMERLKIFSERDKGCRMMLAAQLNKDGKETGAASLTRSKIRGSGAVTDKANVVIILHREMMADGSYSREATVKVDKNTMGKTGKFTQYTNNCYNWLDEKE